MKDFRFGKVQVRFDAKEPCFELLCIFLVFLRYARAMYEFGVSPRLWMIVFMVSRLNKVFEKSFEVWNHNWKVLGLVG